ncbi:MAG: nucleotidyltransferase domain-containing protein [Candidatus Uhrbacteria bacterium]
MNQTLLSLTEEMKRQLVQLGVMLCYAHGSVVKGTAMRESDLDVAVLFDEMPADALRVMAQVTDALSGLAPGRELDIAILNEASPLFKQVVAVEGHILYARSEDDRIRFEFRAMHEYESSKHIHRIAFRAMMTRPAI